MTISIFLTISFTLNVFLFIFLVRYYKEVVVFRTIKLALFNSKWELSLQVMQKNWNTIVIQGFDNIAKSKLQAKVCETIKKMILSDELNVTQIIETLKTMAFHGQNNSIFGDIITKSAHDTLEDHKLRWKLDEKIRGSFWMLPIGQRIIFIAGILPDKGERPFLIEKILQVGFFENRFLDLIEPVIHKDFIEKISTLPDDEKTALQKISSFYYEYDSHDIETRHLTETLAKLFQQKEPVAA